MRFHRRITIPVTITALVLTLVPAASASSLLSGYGGPGQGNQAILGSTLINGPTGGGGGPGSSGSGEGARGVLSTAAPTPGSTSRGGAAPAPHGSPAGKRSAGAGAGAPGDASKTVSGAQSSSTVPVAPASATAASPALGLSGTDVLYVLLAAVALVATGLVTRRMARGPG